MNPPDDSASPAPPIPPASPPPAGADNYVLGAEIARGGMGYILEAEDVKLKRTVAAKLMIFDSDTDEGIRQRFLREAEVLALLSHPNIVPIHDIVWENGAPLFYTMKRINGRTLQAILRDLRKEDAAAQRDFTLDRLLLVFRKICDALACAHSKGIIHRDLKPENIMIGEFGEVLVMDWGIAKMLGGTRSGASPSADGDHGRAGAPPSESGGTMAGSVMGTPQFMSPEQARGEIETLDERSDVFSLGGILYAILALRPPVKGATLAEILKKVSHGEIEPLRTPRASRVVPGAAPGSAANSPVSGAGARDGTRGAAANQRHIPPALAAVTMKALALEKADRYQSVAELSAEIEAYQAGFATKAEQAGLATQLVLLIKRHKAVFTTAAAAWVLITALGVWFIVNLRAKEQRAIAGEKAAVVEKESTRRALAKAQIALADSAFRNADLAGMVLALEACPADLRDQSWEYLSAKRDASARALAFSAVKNPSDVLAVPGRPGQFVLAGKAAAIALVDVARGDRVVQTFDTDMNGGKALAISGDGSVLAVAGRKARNKGETVLLFDAAAGALRKQLTSPVETGALALNRDGTRLAVADTSVGARAGCAMLDTADGRVLWRMEKRSLHLTFSPDGQRLLVSSAGSRRQVNLLRAEDGVEIAHLDIGVASQAISADGKWIAVGTPEGACYLLDGATGAVLSRGQPCTGDITSMTFTSDHHLLVAGGEGKFNDNRWVFRLLEPQSFTTLGVLFGLQPGAPTAWSLHAQSGELLTADNPPRVWRVPVGREIVKLDNRGQQAWGGCFLSDTVLLGRKDFGMQRFDLSTPGGAVEMGDWTHYRVCASHWASGKFVLGMPGTKLGREEGRDLKLFALENGTAVEKHSMKFDGRTPQIEFDRAGETLVAAPGDGPLEIFDVKSGSAVLKVPGRFARAVFAGAGRNLVALSRRDHAAGEIESVVSAHDGATGATLRSVTHRYRINALVASPDGQLVAIAGSDQMVHVLDAATLAEKSAFRAHDGEITALAFHPAKPIVATAAMDRAVKLWEHGTARQVGEFLGLGGTPVVLAFNPSGTLLLVDGQERTMRVFDVSGGNNLFRGR